jgi:hypothetical protein
VPGLTAQVCFRVRVQGRLPNQLLDDVGLHFVSNGTSRMLVPAGVLEVALSLSKVIDLRSAGFMRANAA